MLVAWSAWRTPHDLVLLALAALKLLRAPASDFVHQGATVVSLVGLLLFGLGLSEALSLGDRTVAGALALAAAALFVASAEPVHRFACAGVTIAAGAWWLVGPTAAGLALLPPLLVAFTVGAPALLALALALATLATGLVGYYYQMPVPLLDKALGLAVAGAVLALLHLGLRRWPRGASP